MIDMQELPCQRAGIDDVAHRGRRRLRPPRPSRSRQVASAIGHWAWQCIHKAREIPVRYFMPYFAAGGQCCA